MLWRCKWIFEVLKSSPPLTVMLLVHLCVRDVPPMKAELSFLTSSQTASEGEEGICANRPWRKLLFSPFSMQCSWLSSQFLPIPNRLKQLCVVSDQSPSRHSQKNSSSDNSEGEMFICCERSNSALASAQSYQMSLIGRSSQEHNLKKINKRPSLIASLHSECSSFTLKIGSTGKYKKL